MIDFHCHLDLYRDPVLAAEDADRAGVYVLSVTTTPKAWKKTSNLAAGKPRIRTALGLHPEVAAERIAELQLFEAFARDTRYFGEIGLDGSPQYKATQEGQLRVFNTILSIAEKSGGKILSIHSRRAADEVLDSLAAHGTAGTPVLHWFSGSPAQLKRAVNQGCWFSCGPAMFKSASGRAIVKSIPRNRILTETDGPFALEGSRPLQPGDVWRAVEGLAEMWNEPSDVVAQILHGNLRELSSTLS
ncbi:TatD family hydrolase [Phyllobacterium sp. LjRoot231]|uniref:Qat anti-phage system TatD family nuclease QatD n=1 Tax=Phyllobacterium sp. LjRoot231 TaxID=3342289 RepID=UPI003ECEDE08